MPHATPSRRTLLQLAGAAVLAPGLTGARAAAPIGRVLAIADMHSAYDKTGLLLAAFEREVTSVALPHVIAINGDIFEHGNAVSVRSGGAVDWAFLAQAAQLAPTVVNLGNHDNDLTPDLAEVTARMRSLGVLVVSNIVDTRTGANYASGSVAVPFGSRRLQVVGVATDALSTYPRASRDQLSVPAPADWARAHLAELTEGPHPVLILSHAGVVADRSILPLLPDGALMVGGHDHLLFQHRQGRSAYAHTGSWTSAYTVGEFLDDGSVTARSVPIGADAPSSPRLQSLIDATLAAYQTEADRAVIGVSPLALSVGETGRRIAAGFAEAADADAGFIGHTTLGAGLPVGPVTRHRFDAVVRFDGRLMTADIPVAQLPILMARANQDRPMPLDERSGDFVYGARSRVRAARGDTARIVTTDWCAAHPSEYFGTTELQFAEVLQSSVKGAAAAALFEA